MVVIGILLKKKQLEMNRDFTISIDIFIPP